MQKKKEFILTVIFIGIANILSAQSIDFSNVKLNQSILSTLTLTELKASNAKIDSIKATPIEMDMATFDSLIYIGESYYEYYKDSDKCVLGVVDFENEETALKIGHLIFNNSTTISEVSKYFSSDCSTLKSISIYEKEGDFRSCDIPVTFQGQLTDSRMIFFFKNGKLNRIDFWDEY